MLPALLALALTLPPALPKAPSPGPTLPAVKGLTKPIPMSANVSDLVDWSLKEMGQAVVVVEGQLSLPVPKVNTGVKVFSGGLQLFRPVLHTPTEIGVAPWMDLTTVGAPGNPAGKMYPMGWGY